MIVEIKLNNFEAVIERLRQQKKSIPRGLKRSMQEVGEYVKDRTEQLFSDSASTGLHFGGSRGVYWPDRKFEGEYTWPKLIKSGKLRSSIKYRTRTRNPKRGRWSGSVNIFSDPRTAHYGWRHQYGDKENNVPSRPFLFLSPDERLEIEDIIGAGATKALRKARFRDVRF